LTTTAGSPVSVCPAGRAPGADALAGCGALGFEGIGILEGLRQVFLAEPGRAGLDAFELLAVERQGLIHVR